MNGAVAAAREPVDEAQGMPGWVKAFVFVAVAVVALLVLGKITGIGGEHGPGRHGGGSEQPAPDGESDGGHRSPVDHTP